MKKLSMTIIGSFLAFVLVFGSFALQSNYAHAATLSQTVQTVHLSSSVAQSNEQIKDAASHLRPECAGSITYNSYWWGWEWYLPPCYAALAAAGVSVIPVVGVIGAAAIAAAIALSCNGSIYIDELITGGAYPRPAC